MSSGHRWPVLARPCAGRGRRPVRLGWPSGVAGLVTAVRLDRVRGDRFRGDRGSVTAELAAGLPALMLLLFVGLSAVSAVTTKLRCVDAAREAARTAARGEPGAAAGRRTAPDGAQVAVTVAGDTVTATVRAPVRPLGSHLPKLTVAAVAVAAAEPGPPQPAP